MKFLYIFLFLWVLFALLDPDPYQATQMNADPCGSGTLGKIKILGSKAIGGNLTNSVVFGVSGFRP
jgi:hypothetical protein